MKKVLAGAAAFCLAAFCASAQEQDSSAVVDIDTALAKGTFNSVSVSGFVEAIDNPKLFGGTLSTEIVLMAEHDTKLVVEPSFKMGYGTYTQTFQDSDNTEEHSGMFYGGGFKVLAATKLNDFMNLRIGLDPELDIYDKGDGRTGVGVTFGLLGGVELFPRNVISFVLDVVPSLSDKVKFGFECPVSLALRFNFWNLLSERERPKYHKSTEYLINPDAEEEDDDEDFEDLDDLDEDFE